MLELENSDEDDIEIGRKAYASSSANKRKKRLDSYTPPPSSDDEDVNGDDEHEDEIEDQRMKETVERHPIRLTIRHSSCTIKEGAPTSTVSSSVFLPTSRQGDRRRSAPKKKQMIDEESASDLSSSTTASDADEDDRRASNGSKSKRKRVKNRKRSKIAEPALSTDPAEPPELQVMVSDSELWFINERNSKHKQETASTIQSSAADVDNGGELIATSIQHDSVSNHLFGETAPSDQSEARLNVVITDVKAHNYSVVIKECYQPVGFFKNPS